MGKHRTNGRAVANARINVHPLTVTVEELLVQCVGELARGVAILDGEAGHRAWSAMVDTLDQMGTLVGLASQLARDAERGGDHE